MVCWLDIQAPHPLLTFVLASLKTVLNLNDPVETSTSDDSQSNGPVPSSTAITSDLGEPVWKVLVFDDLGRDVISSVLRVSDLRSLGITMHM